MTARVFMLAWMPFLFTACTVHMSETEIKDAWQLAFQEPPMMAGETVLPAGSDTAQGDRLFNLGHDMLRACYMQDEKEVYLAQLEKIKKVFQQAGRHYAKARAASEKFEDVNHRLARAQLMEELCSRLAKPYQ